MAVAEPIVAGWLARTNALSQGRPTPPPLAGPRLRAIRPASDTPPQIHARLITYSSVGVSGVWRHPPCLRGGSPSAAPEHRRVTPCTGGLNKGYPKPLGPTIYGRSPSTYQTRSACPVVILRAPSGTQPSLSSTVFRRRRRHTYASIMLEAGESVVALARWLGHSSPVITLGYYAHFMPEAGSKGRGTTVCLGAGRPARQPKLPRFSPAPLTGDSCLYAPEESSVDCKAEEMGGLGKCWKRS